MKDQHIRLVPIIDAGVKIEEGYDVYEEGKENGYFCKREDGSDFEAAVWPGLTHFPDVLNPEARAWFGSKYKFLTDQGIEGFWNDMCEPAIFYTPEGVAEYREYLKNELLTCEVFPNFDARTKAEELANSPKDYKRFYHNVNGEMVRHDKVHNLYGMNMTRSASEGLELIAPNKRFLLFSRSSFIGAHRYGGVWTGDNCAWWSHILLNIKMMPSLNMCGFLYTGADLGGFGAHTTRDLLLRWLAVGVFTPLMRNHSALGTREQECFRFEKVEDFRHVVGVRYRLLPYIYSEFMKAALNDDMYCKPLAFEFPEDAMARQVEDQLLIGNEIMIAPVYTQNATGRYVYLPEEMKFIKFLPDGTISEEILEQGHHYVDIALNEVPLFIRKDKCIPVVDFAEYVDAIDMSTKKMIGYENAEYDLYDDDGVSTL
jgi:alpha-glucosidase